MADINVDVNLPSAINVDITSPTQALAANVSIPGPQGPRGPGNNINNLSTEFLYITGRDGILVSSNNVDVIYISGNSGHFQSAVDSLKTNLNLTGANLNTSINNLNELFTGYTGTLDATYATDIQLATTGSTLQTNINTLTTNVGLTGSTLATRINNLSGYINSTSSNIVYTTGDQYIDGLKTFSSDTFFEKDIDVTKILRVSGNSFFSSNLNVTGNLNVSGSINNSTLVLTKNKQTISGNKTFADNMSINAYTGNGYDTSNLDFKLNIGGDINENAGILIDSYGTNPPQILMRRARGTPTDLSGVLKDDVLFNLQARGYVSGLNNYSANSRAAIRLIAAENWVGGGVSNGEGTSISFRTTNTGTSSSINKVIIGTSGINVLDGSIYISGNSVLTGIDLSSYVTTSQTGNFYAKSNPSGYITGIDLSSYATTANLATTGSTLDTKINSLSGTLTGNYAAITDSGINIIAGTYRVNNIPYNTFSINFLSSNSNLIVGQNYISNVGGGYSSTFSDRSIPMFENCTARKASISLLNSGPGNNIVGITGYFINVSTNPPQTGIINLAISAPVGSNQYTYTGAFTTPINISFGDNVVCSLNSNIIATNVRTAASIYCYN